MRDVIISSKSGNSLDNERRVRRYLGNDFRYHITKKKGDLEELVAKAEGDIIIGAGDSGVDEGIKGLAEAELLKKLKAVIPLGSANNFSRNMNLYGIGGICRLLKRIQKGEESIEEYLMPVDILKITYDGDETVYTASSFSVGWTSLTTFKAESSYAKIPLAKKLHYVLQGIKTVKSYEPFDAEITYTNTNEECKTVYVKQGSSVGISLGCICGSFKNFNPGACQNDQKIEIMIGDDLKFWQWVRLITEMSSERAGHISTEKDERGFNAYGINYIHDVTSFEMRVSQKNNKPVFIETGGSIHKVSYTKLPITVELVEKALKLVHLPYETRIEKFSSWR